VDGGGHEPQHAACALEAPSKLQGRPAVTISSVGSRSR
jgi:hypothetical protein